MIKCSTYVPHAENTYDAIKESKFYAHINIIIIMYTLLDIYSIIIVRLHSKLVIL
jgi:hypothetical protein